jgi:hypothetical protein
MWLGIERDEATEVQIIRQCKNKNNRLDVPKTSAAARE